MSGQKGRKFIFFGVFFFVAFSFAPSSSKEKAGREPSPVGEGVSHRLTDEVLSLA